MSAAASSTCSQLSKIEQPRTGPPVRRLRCLPPTMPGCWVMPSTAATASGTAPVSATGASSITQAPSGKSSQYSGSHLEGEAGLADPADTGQRHQPMCLERCFRLRRVRTRGRRSWSTVGRKFPWRGIDGLAVVETHRAARTPGPETFHRSGDVAQPSVSQGFEVGTAVRRSSGQTVEQDLTAVPGRHDPGGAVEHRRRSSRRSRCSASPVAMPIRTGNSRTRCAAMAASTAACGDENAAHTPSPVCLNTAPPQSVMA